MSARDDAIRIIQSVRDQWPLLPITPGEELDAIPSELLHRVADERRMTNQPSQEADK